jgi:hypothetical protein
VFLDEAAAEQQKEVQRKLGRCLMRLQQYEKLMKAVLAHHELSGPSVHLEAIRDKRVEEVSRQTLGQLVGSLTTSYLAIDGPAPEQAPVTDDELDAQLPWLSIRLSISMTPERHAETEADLRELVALRNELVHHLLEKFDIWSSDGCKAASDYLEEAYSQIDKAHKTLGKWAKNMETAREHVAAFAASRALQDFLFECIAPDGSVDWETSRIVALLREAETTADMDGWTRLDQAVAAIRVTHPDVSPSRYKCRTWREVLHVSKAFTVRRKKLGESGEGLTLFKSKPLASRNA